MPKSAEELQKEMDALKDQNQEPNPEETPLEGVEVDDGVEIDETPDEAPPPEESPERPINQESVEKKINKITFEKHEEIRKREALEKELQEVKEKLTSLSADEEKIEIPPVPDTFDPDYQVKLQARDAALSKAAEVRAKKKLQEERELAIQQQHLLDEQAKAQKLVEAMYSSADKLGVSAEELKQADETVAKYVRDPSLAQYILGVENSPLVVKYLANSAEALEKIQSMNAVQATAYIVQTVLPEAEKLKPELTETPEPIDIPGGKPSSEPPNEFLDGVEFE